jgi:hypothetical protein
MGALPLLPEDGAGSKRASGKMTSTLTEKLALSVLAREGIGAIWQLQLAAADAHRTGRPNVAAAILEIADAAEAASLRSEVMRSFAV